MRRPSRLMPVATPSPSAILGWLFIAVLIGSTVYVGYVMFSKAPWATSAGAALLVLVSIYSSRRRKRRLEALAQVRGGESICEFARSFDARNVDTWVIRAVYEELQRELADAVPNFPVRASDVLLKDLLEDSDDLDMSLAPNVSKRTGRSLDDFPENPYFGKVRTVEDLVLFFNAQPHENAT
jgi:hypothetical protein